MAAEHNADLGEVTDAQLHEILEEGGELNPVLKLLDAKGVKWEERFMDMLRSSA